MCRECRRLTTSVPGEARTDRRLHQCSGQGVVSCLVSGPTKATATESQLEAEAASPGGGWGRPGSPQHASIRKSVFPKARARRLCIEMTLCGLGWAFFILTVVCLFLWLPSIYGHRAGFLLTEDGEFLPDQTGTLVRGRSGGSEPWGVCLWSICCAPGPANRLSQAAGGWWARG